MPSTLPPTSSRQIVILPDIPELYNPRFLDVLLPPPQDYTSPTKSEATLVDEAPKNAMMDALAGTAQQTLTENKAAAYSSTLSPTLDAFQLLAHADSNVTFNQMLDNAWDEDPNLTLRIIWNIRSIHDGKGNKAMFYNAFGWLYENHPRTAIHNLKWLIEPVCTRKNSDTALAHGYWKDLLNIVALAALDELRSLRELPRFLHTAREKHHSDHKRFGKGDPASNIAESLQRDAERKAAAQTERFTAAKHRYQNLVNKLTEPKFKALYIAVARLFSDRLLKDLEILRRIKALAPNDDRVLSLQKQISLAGKWAPTPMGSHDRHTNLATSISLLLRNAQPPLGFPSALNKPMEPSDAALLMRSFFQRWILTSLRAASEVTERLMSSNHWTDIKYNRVPSLCMKANTENFYTHDPKGFEKYLTSVEKGGTTVSGATLFPHVLIHEVYALGAVPPLEEGHVKLKKKAAKLKKARSNAAKLRTIEAQWKTLVGRLRGSGTLDNAIAVCDVSGSMGVMSQIKKLSNDMNEVQPILPAIALSLLLASLTKPPFNAGFITFSTQPKYVKLDLSKPLYETIVTMCKSEWGGNTNLNAVFTKLLLPLAIKNNVPQDQMIKRIFVFTDMQFDSCMSRNNVDNWTTNHDKIEEAYKDAGYEVPQIVYWDLSRHGTVEVSGNREGVAMMNGFSPALLKVFMGEDAESMEWEEVDKSGNIKTVKVKEEFNPIDVMKKAVMQSSFDGLEVVD